MQQLTDAYSFGYYQFAFAFAFEVTTNTRIHEKFLKGQVQLLCNSDFMTIISVFDLSYNRINDMSKKQHTGVTSKTIKNYYFLKLGTLQQLLAFWSDLQNMIAAYWLFTFLASIFGSWYVDFAFFVARTTSI